MEKRRLNIVSRIQSQESVLEKVENELRTILNQVNENINTLKVEELQLRSDAITKLLNGSPQKLCVPTEADYQNTNDMWLTTPIKETSPDLINKQFIDLDIFTESVQHDLDDDTYTKNSLF